MDDRRPRAAIEAPGVWGQRRMLITHLERLGYAVEDLIILGDHLLVLTASDQRAERTLAQVRTLNRASGHAVGALPGCFAVATAGGRFHGPVDIAQG